MKTKLGCFILVIALAVFPVMVEATDNETTVKLVISTTTNEMIDGELIISIATMPDLIDNLDGSHQPQVGGANAGRTAFFVQEFMPDKNGNVPSMVSYTQVDVERMDLYIYTLSQHLLPIVYLYTISFPVDELDCWSVMVETPIDYEEKFVFSHTKTGNSYGGVLSTCATGGAEFNLLGFDEQRELLVSEKINAADYWDLTGLTPENWPSLIETSDWYDVSGWDPGGWLQIPVTNVQTGAKAMIDIQLYDIYDWKTGRSFREMRDELVATQVTQTDSAPSEEISATTVPSPTSSDANWLGGSGIITDPQAKAPEGAKGALILELTDKQVWADPLFTMVTPEFDAIAYSNCLYVDSSTLEQVTAVWNFETQTWVPITSSFYHCSVGWGDDMSGVFYLELGNAAFTDNVPAEIKKEARFRLIPLDGSQEIAIQYVD